MASGGSFRRHLWILLSVGCLRHGAPAATAEPVAVRGPPPGMIRARTLYLEGRTALERDELDVAAERLRQARLFDPNSAEICVAMGDVELRRGGFEAARAHWTLAVEVDPDHAEAWVRLARISRLMGDAASAAQHYARGVEAGAGWPARAGLVDSRRKLDDAEGARAAIAAWSGQASSDWRELAERGSRRLDLGDPHGAMDDLGRALMERPRRELLLERYLEAARVAGRLGPALLHLDQVLVGAPTDLNLVQRQYQLARDLGDWDRALDAVGRLEVQLGGGDPGLGIDRARLLVLVGRPEDAARALDGVTEGPGLDEVRARVLAARGDPAAALEALGPHSATEPAERLGLRLEWQRAAGQPDAPVPATASPAHKRQYARHFLALGRVEAAEALVLGADRTREDLLTWAWLLVGAEEHARALPIVRLLQVADVAPVELARLLIALGEPADAIEVLASAGDDVDALYLRAHTLWRLGESTQAIALVRQVIGRAPDHAAAHNLLGYALISGVPGVDPARALAEAESHISFAVSLEPGNGHYLDSQGWLLLQIGRRDEAIQVLERAARYAPDSGEIRAHLLAARESP